ncbi:toxin-antitoxin system, toxin component [Streptomyces griseorubiginosus]|uniref:Toxin-antitoxin system, toxin component n=1 Tax=Streptomyces griseorubiginosus TaxID=67304 RepID=A0A101RRA3_9ACTN|nr:toxin-antitoxin system, toxin component [Streptomyces griseorubiginosus]
MTDSWQKSSHCQEGDACVHISTGPDQVHITDSPAAQTIVTVSRAAFDALLKSL